jgi:hypothetical protein
LGASSRDIRLQGSLFVAGEALSVPDWVKTSWYASPTGLPSREDWEKQMGHPVPRHLPAQRGSFTMDNTCMEMKDASLLMKLHYQVAKWVVRRSFRENHDPDGPAWKMMLTCATDCPLRATVISAGGRLPEWLVRGMLWIINRRYFPTLTRSHHSDDAP